MKLSDLTAENIRNTKIHVKSPEESRAFQKRVFELGAHWYCSVKKEYEPKYIDAIYLYVASDLKLEYGNIEKYFDSALRGEIQIDFTNKPDWKDAPDWAQWLAQDENGRWCWYEKLPTRLINSYNLNSVIGRFRVTSMLGIPNPNWCDTLEQRPKNEMATLHLDGYPKGEPIQDLEIHYRECTIEPIEYILANDLDFCAGNVVKYVTRYKHKNGIDDLKKAKSYLEILISKESEA